MIIFNENMAVIPAERGREREREAEQEKHIEKQERKEEHFLDNKILGGFSCSP